MIKIHLGPVSDQDARAFLNIAKFSGKDSAREQRIKAIKAFDALGWKYRITIGGDAILATWKGYGSEQFEGDWVPNHS